jgi:hypothetical protein
MVGRIGSPSPAYRPAHRLAAHHKIATVFWCAGKLERLRRRLFA